jgi:hypothetical protein
LLTIEEKEEKGGQYDNCQGNLKGANNHSQRNPLLPNGWDTSRRKEAKTLMILLRSFVEDDQCSRHQYFS